jgi:hypothetical protein
MILVPYPIMVEASLPPSKPLQHMPTTSRYRSFVRQSFSGQATEQV